MCPSPAPQPGPGPSKGPPEPGGGSSPARLWTLAPGSVQLMVLTDSSARHRPTSGSLVWALGLFTVHEVTSPSGRTPGRNRRLVRCYRGPAVEAGQPSPGACGAGPPAAPSDSGRLRAAPCPSDCKINVASGAQSPSPQSPGRAAKGDPERPRQRASQAQAQGHSLADRGSVLKHGSACALGRVAQRLESWPCTKRSRV